MTDISSALETALERVGDRWTLLVVAALLDGPRRFGDLQEAVPGVASNILTSRVRSLEQHGLVVRRPSPGRPPRVHYTLTDRGLALAGALRTLATWEHQSGGAETPRHPACGTPMESRWWCPTCALPADPDEVEAYWV